MASRGLGAVIGKTKPLSDLGFKTFEKLFTTGVVPIMHYGSEVWGFKRFHLTESIENRAIHFYFGLHKFTPIAARRSEVGLFSTRCKQWINMVKYWNRLVNMSQSRLISKLFHWDYEKSVYNNNWCSSLLHDHTYVQSIKNIISESLRKYKYLEEIQKLSFWTSHFSQKPHS